MEKKLICIVSAIWLLSITAGAQDFNEVFKAVASDREANDWFGSSVSISGNYAIVGARDEGEDAEGANHLDLAGSAYIFERDGSGNWTQVQKIVASDRAVADYFGGSVSISGNYAIVGACHENHDAEGGNWISDAGSAYIFERDGSGNWTEVQKIVASDRGASDQFGFSLSILGKYAFIGAWRESEDAEGGNTLYYAGSAYIFEREGSGNWTQVQKIVASDRAMADYFGNSVSISGNYAIIGALYESDDAEGGNTLNYAGSAYIFERDGNGNWSEMQKIVASDRAKEDYFGSSVSISGNYAIIGTWSEDEDAAGGNTLSNAGSAYIFECDGNGSWNEVQKIVAPDRATSDKFGTSVSISGNHVLVGACEEDEDAAGGNTLNEAGSAFIFERDGSGNWTEVQKITAPDRAEGDRFGSSVSISGNYALVGAWYEDEDAAGGNTLPSAGSAYIFESCTPGGASDPGNIIENGDFEDCILLPWFTYLYDPVVNTLNPVLVDGECVLSGITVGDGQLAWHIQLMQTFTEEQKNKLEAGATYELSFDAKAEAEGREIYVFFGQNVDTWTAFITENIVVGTEKGNFSFEFNLTSVLPLMRFLLGVGQESTGLTIDNVKLVKKVTSSIKNNSSVDGIRIRPNPATDFILVEAQEGSTVKLYNGLGVLVKEGTTENGQIQLKVSDLSKGFYLVEISNGNTITTDKVIVK